MPEVGATALRDQAEYEAALEAVRPYFEKEPEAETPEASHFDSLVRLIATYEAEHYPIHRGDRNGASLIDVGDEDYNRVMAGLDDAKAIIAALDDEVEDAADAALYADRMAELVTSGGALNATNCPGIPKLICFIPPSEAAVAMHEAGHAIAALAVEAWPEYMELINKPSLHGRNRIPKISDNHHRQIVSVAGFAVEVALFEANRLIDDSGNAVEMKEFMHQSLGLNSEKDKNSFFGEDRKCCDGFWPTEDDLKFRDFGVDLSQILPIDRVEAFATELIATRKVSLERMNEIWDSFIPDDEDGPTS